MVDRICGSFVGTAVVDCLGLELQPSMCSEEHHDKILACGIRRFLFSLDFYRLSSATSPSAVASIT